MSDWLTTRMGGEVQRLKLSREAIRADREFE
jgi:hypothetical protein